MEQFEIITDINNEWASYPKNTLCTDKRPNGETEYWLAWESGAVRLLLKTVVGRRKGLREEIYLIDNARSIYWDRLRLADVTTIGDGRLLPLTVMRNEVRACGQDPHEIAKTYMRRLLDDLLARPGWYLRFKLRGSGPQGMSVNALQGGAPGLGRRH